MVKELCDFLTAFKQYLYQAHLSARGKAYAAHLLAEKLQKEVAEDIDRLKELYIVFTGDLSIANAQESLKQAELTLRAFLQDKPQEPKFPEIIKQCAQLAFYCMAKAESVSAYLGDERDIEGARAYKKALQNAVDDICEHCARYRYLLDTESENGNND